MCSYFNQKTLYISSKIIQLIKGITGIQMKSFLLAIVFFIAQMALGQSEEEKLIRCKIHKNKSIQKLDSHFVYVRGFEICGLNCGCHKPPPEYKLNLQADHEYEVRISNWRGNICAILKNASKKAIAYSFKGRYYDGFKFKCRQSGIYYIQFNTPAPHSHYTMIGGACLGVKRKETSNQQRRHPIFSKKKIIHNTNLRQPNRRTKKR